MQINNNTKTMMIVLIVITPLTFLLFSLFRLHLEIKSIFLELPKSEPTSFSFEKTD